MGRMYSHHATSDTTLTTTTETVVATISDVTTAKPGERVNLRGWAQVTTGGSTTALTLRIRKGTTISGTLIGEATVEQVEAAAGSTEAHDISVDDSPGEVAYQSYVLTVQQTAAAANGSCVQASLVGEIIN